MALKLLQPGMQPAGQFDLKDGVSLSGGEYVELTASSDYAASDVSAVGPATYMQPGIRSLAAAVKFGGLADEGTTGYGTSFGTIIGATVGQGTGFGTLSTTGVVVVGPQTSTGSGKVTVWHAPGLYGVSGSPATAAAVAPLSGLAVNVIVEAEAATGYLGGAGTGAGSTVGVTVGAVKDTSLVSTTATAAGESAQTEFYAIYMTAINGVSA
jgi:hypothetical protein